MSGYLFNKKENPEYLTNQLITYIGNKRLLISNIEKILNDVRNKLGKEKLVTLDMFSGSGVVARLMKQYSSTLIVNDLEMYSKVINDCFLSNKSDFDNDLFNHYLNQIYDRINEKPIKGIISKNYAPKNTSSIKMGERAFYSHENAVFIDSFRHYIDEIVCENYKKYFYALLITEASIHVNTCGVFKGFYKDKYTGIGKFGGNGENALSRILSSIKIEEPILSNFDTNTIIFQDDAKNILNRIGKIDFAYLDPPYNQHPYGSNYFMLNLIISNKIDVPISRVSGIPTNWNRSDFNKRSHALTSLEEIIQGLDSKYILISYNNEGFISYDQMYSMLCKYGKVDIKTIKYNTFRGSHNLKNRELHTDEYMFLLEKEE